MQAPLAWHQAAAARHQPTSARRQAPRLYASATGQHGAASAKSAHGNGRLATVSLGHVAVTGRPAIVAEVLPAGGEPLRSVDDPGPSAWELHLAVYWLSLAGNEFPVAANELPVAANELPVAANVHTCTFPRTDGACPRSSGRGRRSTARLICAPVAFSPRKHPYGPPQSRRLPSAHLRSPQSP